MEKQEKWFKLKKYPHIGKQLTDKDYKWVKSYVKNKEEIKSHSFSPFIHRTSKVKKFRRKYDEHGLPVLKKDGKTIDKLRKASVKNRELYYANHIDSMIYSYYSFLLSKNYEKILRTEKISNCVTAYRRIIDPITKKGKCNIDFAEEVFEKIRNNLATNDKQVVIAFDIKGFFDNLSHNLLKESWKKVLNFNREPNKLYDELPLDHYKVFKNITKFSFINENELFNEFKTKIIIKRFESNTKRKIVTKNKNIKKKKYLKNQRAVSYCNYEDLNKLRKKGLIKSNKRYSNRIIRKKGIPQGSPISANLANIYMLDFDVKFNNYVNSLNGFYRRYSDDLIVIVDPNHKEQVIEKIQLLITKLCQLKIQDKKTQIFHFSKNKGVISCYQEINEKKIPNKDLEYLGFRFNGENTFLKNSSISSYYRKMKRTIKRRKRYSKMTSNDKIKGVVFVNSLVKRFTHIGAKKVNSKYRNNKKEFVPSNIKKFGNYISYAKKATKIMKYNKIKKQLRNHWKFFKKTIK